MNLAAWVVRVSAWLVPAEWRSEWRREWLAEIQARHPRAGAGRPSPGPLRFALGAPVHALWLGAEPWWPRTLRADLVSAWRFLRRRPALASSAILTLTLGIGATTAAFSVVHGVLLKPLPYRDPAALVQLWESNPLFNWTEAEIAPGNLISWRERHRVFTDIAWYSGSATRQAGQLSLTLGGEEPVRVIAQPVSANFFDVLGVSAELGRGFVAGEDQPGRPRVVVLSHPFWQRRFGGDPTVIGRTVPLNSRDVQVIGVMPAAFTFDQGDTDFWMPLTFDVKELREVRVPHWLRAVARLRPGVTIDQARADLAGIARDLEREHPESNRQMAAGLGPLDDWFVGQSRRPLLLFLAAVGLVLAIACANVANLLLARTAERLKEMTLRAALGATRLRLLRQLLLESLVIAATGTVLGVALAAAGVRVLMARTPVELPRQAEIGLHPAVLIFAIALTVATTIVVGIAPALHASGADLRDGLSEGSRTTGARGARLRRTFVAVQIALAAVLLVGTMLTLRSFGALMAVDPGFRVENLVTARIALPAARYGADGRSATFFETLGARLRAHPSVQAAGATIRLPLEGAAWTGRLFIEGRPDVHLRELRHKSITSGYFEALGLRLIAGRTIQTTDRSGATLVVVVNETLARRFFPNEDPVGHRVAFDPPASAVRWRTIVGVVSDEPQDRLGKPAIAEVYDSELQEEWSQMAVAIRSSAPPADVIRTLKSAVHDLDPQLALYDAGPYADRVKRSVGREQVAVWLTSVFGIIALVLAAIGTYGIAAYAVATRTREIGVRVACGATAAAVSRMIVREHLLVVGIGLVAGLAAALAAGRFVGALLYGVSPTDAVSLGGSLAVLLIIGIVASAVPARRALRIDPVTVLRAEH
jgi:putative ABC transport system permease protein